MEREYQLSRKILCIIAIIISFIVLLYEDISVKLVGISLFTGVTLLTSYLGSGISKKMIRIGDKISTGWLRFLYYVFLFILIPTTAIAFWLLINLIYDALSNSTGFVADLGQAILLGASFFVFLLVPYVQTLIILFLRRTLK